MHAIDFSPLFRSTIGFDRMQRFLDGAGRMDEQSLSYPPYNIEARGDDAYRITMAVAGFGEDDLDVTVKENRLVVSGKVGENGKDVNYLHRGIAGRSFERRFELAGNVKVVDARLANGLLEIDLERVVPEEHKLRRVAIGTGPRAIEDKAA